MVDGQTSAEISKPTRVDRIAPRTRPAGPPQGFQQWRSLLFLHWPVPAQALRELVPAPLELDFYDGIAYVGVVPFAMQGVRPAWWPPSCAMRFLETNVRIYVTHDGRPGVYFLSLDAASRVAVWAARWLWGLPYFYASMEMKTGGATIQHTTTRNAGGPVHRVRYRIGESLGQLEPDSLEFFLLERYLLFVERRGQVWSGQVYHTPYPVQRAEVLEIDDQLRAAAGLNPDRRDPELAHYAAGVDVEIFGLKPIGR